MQHDVSTIADRAWQWAVARLDDTSYATRCLAFVEDAIERANSIEVFGGSDARESADIYAVNDDGTSPPRGALVFFDCFGPLFGSYRNWGHVGLSDGEGRMVHAWDRVRIDPVDGVPDLAPAPGWTAPRAIGWVALERALAGSRPRDWESGETH